MADSGNVLTVSVVSAERALWTGTAKSLVAKTPEGDIGILPGHEPVLALLVDSAPLKLVGDDGTTTFVAVHGGFFSVAGNDVNVIAEVAELARDIDVDRAQAALARAEAGERDEEAEYAIHRAQVRIQVAGVAAGSTNR